MITTSRKNAGNFQMIKKTVSVSNITLAAFRFKALKKGGSSKSHMDSALEDAAKEFYQECADLAGVSLEEWLNGKGEF